MRKRAVCLRWALVAAAAVAVIESVTAVPAGAATLVTPDSVSLVGDAGTTLTPPSDGRIAGAGFVARVIGVAIGYRFGFGAAARDASPGQRLVAFEPGGTVPGQNIGSDTVEATLVVDGARQPLPAARSASAEYLASVPSTAKDVAVELAVAGFAQTFSLTKGAREGLAPAVLYRSAGDWEATVQVGQTVNFPTPIPGDGSFVNASTDLTLRSASLTWFGPAQAAPTPGDASMAWLVLDATSAQHAPGPVATLLYDTALDPSQVTVTLPGGQPAPAMLAGRGGPADQTTQRSGLLAGVYYFQVPATTTTATVTITPGTIQAESSYLGSATPIAVPGQATFALDFGTPYQAPPAVPPPVQALPATGPLPTSPVAGAPARPSHGGSSFPAGILIAIAAGLLIAAGAGFGLRRRSRRPAPLNPVPQPHAPQTPVVWRPAGQAPPASRWQTPAPPASEQRAEPPTGRKADTRVDPSLPPPVPVPSRPDPVVDSHDQSATTPLQQTGEPNPVPPGPTSAEPPVQPTPATPAVAPPPAIPVLVEPPVEPPQLPDCVVEVQVLGPPRVVGWPSGAAEPTSSELELLAFLALHPDRRFASEDLRARVGTGREREWKRQTLSDYAISLRRALGAERIPEARAGYHSIGVSTDAARFAELRSSASAAPDPVAAAQLLARALTLVRGVPFAGASRGSYGWADDPPLATELAVSVVDVAADLAGRAIIAGDRRLAIWATERGLAVWPTDEGLHELALTAAATDAPRLEQAWMRTTRMLAANRVTPSDRLRFHYQRLRDGF